MAKHSVSFEQAATVFAGSNSLTIPDPVHSVAEERWITVGRSYSNKLLIVVYTERAEGIRIISARAANRREETFMKAPKTGDAMLANYDFSRAERGKYAKSYRKGSNVVVLDPDVAKIFGNAASVNRSLRSLARTRLVTGKGKPK